MSTYVILTLYLNGRRLAWVLPSGCSYICLPNRRQHCCHGDECASKPNYSKITKSKKAWVHGIFIQSLTANFKNENCFNDNDVLRL